VKYKGRILVCLVAGLSYGLWHCGRRLESQARPDDAFVAAAPRPPATEAPPVGELTPRSTVESPEISAHASLPTPEPATEVKPETEQEFKLRTFQALLDQFDGKPMAHTDWPGYDRQRLAPMLMAMSVSAVMDAAGTSEPEHGDGIQRPAFSGDGRDCGFDYNGRMYRFRRGEFPVYDRWVELEREALALERANAAAAIRFEPYVFPEEFFVLASDFAHEAISLRQ